MYRKTALLLKRVQYEHGDVLIHRYIPIKRDVYVHQPEKYKFADSIQISPDNVLKHDFGYVIRHARNNTAYDALPEYIFVYFALY